MRPSRRAAEGQITNPLREQVFRELEQPPKSVRVEDMETNAFASLPRAELPTAAAECLLGVARRRGTVGESSSLPALPRTPSTLPVLASAL